MTLRIHALMVAALSTGLSACGQSPSDRLDGASQSSVAEFGQEFTLRPGQAVRLGGTRSTFAFIAVPEDSRCHPTVVCIWAGNARLSLRLDEFRFAINSTVEPRDTLVGGFHITLLQLSQRPLGDTVATNYAATFKVTR